MKRSIPLLVLAASIASFGCGGGGGGGNSDFYAGTWHFTGTKLVDSCDGGFEDFFDATLVVNQDGERVVVNSGSITLVGTTNDDDGFVVTATHPGSRGCQMGSAYSLSNAGDGEADAGLAIVAHCGGLECTLGYGGVATLTSEKAKIEGIGLDQLLDQLQKSTSVYGKFLQEGLADAGAQAETLAEELLRSK